MPALPPRIGPDEKAGIAAFLERIDGGQHYGHETDSFDRTWDRIWATLMPNMVDEILDAKDTIAPKTRHKLGAEPTTRWEPVFVGYKVRPDDIETKLDNVWRWIVEQSVNAKTHLGLLPKILKEILTARKRAKKDMKAATDPMEKAVQNGRQLALKVSANSVYGFTGATAGQLPCLPIAASTTAYGRDLLFQTRTAAEERYTAAHGYKKDAAVADRPLTHT